jgi:hypothetical protein
MQHVSPISKLMIIITTLVGLLFSTSHVQAAPVSFQWGSIGSGTTTYGVYDTDNATILQTGDLTQLIWTGPNGLVDLPQCDGTPGGDDVLLDSTTVQNTGSLPGPLQNKGYIPLKTYTFDTTSAQSGGVIYLRAWNAGTTADAAYGNSSTSTLTGGGTYNALRWYTNNGFSTATWTGPTAGDWQTASSWSTGTVPGCRTNVVVAGSATVSLSANAVSHNLTIFSGATLNLNTFDVTVETTFVNNGTLRQVKDTLSGATTEFLHLRNAAGTVDKYRGVAITPAADMNSTSVTIKGNQTQCTTQSGDQLIKRCFNVSPGTPASATLRFWYTEAERNGQLANALKLWHFSGSWTQVGDEPYSYSESGDTCSSGTFCWMQAAGVASYSPFGLGGSPQPTAITLRSLTTRADSIAWIPIGLALFATSVAIIVVRRRRS